jgi:hypothetical protein
MDRQEASVMERRKLEQKLKKKLDAPPKVLHSAYRTAARRRLIAWRVLSCVE